MASDPADVGGDPFEDGRASSASSAFSNDERALEAVEHMQTAALEMVRAARACLDVVEAIVQDPTPLLEAAAAAGRAAAASARLPGFGPAGHPSGPDDHRAKVEHIRVENDDDA